MTKKLVKKGVFIMGTVIAVLAGYFILSGQASRAFVEWKSKKDDESKK